MSNLFSINERYLALTNMLEDVIDSLEEDENIEQAGEDIIEGLKVTREEAKEKLEAYYYIIKQKEGEIELLKDEQQRLGDKIKTKGNLIDRLKKSVDDALRLYGERTKSGGYKLKTDRLSIWNVFHKPVVVSEDFNNKHYMKFRIKGRVSDGTRQEIIETFPDEPIDFQPELDKVSLKNDLKDGKEIPGARLDKDAAYVRFK